MCPAVFQATINKKEPTCQILSANCQYILIVFQWKVELGPSVQTGSQTFSMMQGTDLLAEALEPDNKHGHTVL